MGSMGFARAVKCHLGACECALCMGIMRVRCVLALAGRVWRAGGGRLRCCAVEEGVRCKGKSKCAHTCGIVCSKTSIKAGGGFTSYAACS